MTRDQYVFATFCPQQKYTDHELDWFDLNQSAERVEPGGDQIFRSLVEEHDARGSRIWPFEDYLIFANSQSKIAAVFKRKVRNPKSSMLKHQNLLCVVITVATLINILPMRRLEQRVTEGRYDFTWGHVP